MVKIVRVSHVTPLQFCPVLVLLLKMSKIVRVSTAILNGCRPLPQAESVFMYTISSV